MANSSSWTKQFSALGDILGDMVKDDVEHFTAQQRAKIVYFKPASAGQPDSSFFQETHC